MPKSKRPDDEAKKDEEFYKKIMASALKQEALLAMRKNFSEATAHPRSSPSPTLEEKTGIFYDMLLENGGQGSRIFIFPSKADLKVLANYWYLVEDMVSKKFKLDVVFQNAANLTSAEDVEVVKENTAKLVKVLSRARSIYPKNADNITVWVKNNERLDEERRGTVLADLTLKTGVEVRVLKSPTRIPGEIDVEFSEDWMRRQVRELAEVGKNSRVVLLAEIAEHLDL
ncbi:MAG: hypothetical protein IT559_06485 [Alphaproteobacteria bacterium]|nr:hypothetical protein [Alphaproteobacteria bacterium]